MSRSDGYRTFPISVRKEILRRDGFRCRVYGRLGPEHSGDIDLETHHMREGPKYVCWDHTDNGAAMCTPCHHLITRRTTADNLLLALNDVAAEVSLLYKDIEIPVYLYEHGPAMTSEIREATSDSARASIIERLWTLISVDRGVDFLDGPFIDRDLDTGEWRYPDDIDRTVRGRIPEEKEKLVNRLRNEPLRRLLDAGVNQSILVLFFGRSWKITSYIAKRAGTTQVPFDDESHPDALMNEDEFDWVVDGMERLFRGSDRSR